MGKKHKKTTPLAGVPTSPAEISRAVKRLERDAAAYAALIGVDGKPTHVANIDPATKTATLKPLNPDDSEGVKVVRFAAPTADVQDLIDKLDGESVNLTTNEGRIESAIPFRMFEPEPSDARQRFRPGDKVQSIRPLMGVPVGAAGEVAYIEHPESAMSSKGRHYYVRFDVTPYQLEFSAKLRAYYETTRRPGDPDMPQYMSFVSTNCGALDLKLIEPGANWYAGYMPDYEADRLNQPPLTEYPPDKFPASSERFPGVIEDNDKPLINGDFVTGENWPKLPANSLDALRRAAAGEYLSPADYSAGFDFAGDADNSPSTRQLNSQIEQDRDIENDGGE